MIGTRQFSFYVSSLYFKLFLFCVSSCSSQRSMRIRRFTTFEDKAWFVENFWETASAELPEFVSEFPDQETFFVNFLRDPIEPTGDEDEDFSTDAPKVYEELPA